MLSRVGSQRTSLSIFKFLHSRSLSCSSRRQKKPNENPKAYLTPERKELLISLYHKSENFVTRENLSSYIDTEFTQGYTGGINRRSSVYGGGRQRYEDDRLRLEREMAQQQAWPKMAVMSARTDLYGRFTSQMTDAKELQEWRRTDRLQAALNGTDESAKPGLDAVEAFQADVSSESTKANPNK